MTHTAHQSARISLISDFNADTFARTLAAQAPELDVEAAPFGRPHECLANHAAGNATPSSVPVDLVVWTQPAGAIASFASALTLSPYDEQHVLGEVDAFAGLISAAAKNCRTLMVASWAIPATARNLGPLDFKPGLGLQNLLMRMNLRLADALAAIPNAFMLDTNRWLSAAGGDAAWSPKMWAAAKVPYAAPVFQAAATDVLSTLNARAGRTRKLLILDLDDTLWGGTVGETGWEGLALGGHSMKGEAFLTFQRRIKALTNRGIILAIASKNDEAVALEAITNHPDMALGKNDFAGWRINWQDKATNIAELLQELKLGADAAVFIDDNPAERARVAQALPDILVPDWPTDPTLAAATLDALACFDTTSITDEDRTRAALYTAERQRAASAPAPGTSPDAWLAQLGVTIQATPLNAGTLTRAAQLFNKTNQMNMATRRMTAEELTDWAAQPANQIITLRVEDKFGDYGLTGILGLSLNGTTTHITDFLLSCRVMGRGVETAMLHLASSWAASHGADRLEANFIKTDRNRPCEEFWQQSGFTEQQPHHFVRDMATPLPAPSNITISQDAPHEDVA